MVSSQKTTLRLMSDEYCCFCLGHWYDGHRNGWWCILSIVTSRSTTTFACTLTTNSESSSYASFRTNANFGCRHYVTSILTQLSVSMKLLLVMLTVDRLSSVCVRPEKYCFVIFHKWFNWHHRKRFVRAFRFICVYSNASILMRFPNRLKQVIINFTNFIYSHLFTLECIHTTD